MDDILSKINAEQKKQIEYFENIDSTNTYLKNKCKEGRVCCGDIVVASAQTNGRGRMGKSFESEANNGIYMSYALVFEKCENLSEITPWIAVAVKRAVKDFCGLNCKIKWVNDIVYNKMKLCGILTETVICNNKIYVICGIGINVNNESFPKEIENTAASIKMITKKEEDISYLFERIVFYTDKMSKDFPHKKAEYLLEYKKDCAIINEDIILLKDNKERNAKAIDISDNFGLVVLYDNNEKEVITSGDVSVKGFYGKN